MLIIIRKPSNETLSSANKYNDTHNCIRPFPQEVPMNRSASLVVSCGLFLGLVAALSAQQQDARRALVAKAIKAHGGADKLNKAEASHVKMTGTLDTMGGIKFSSETFMQPGKFRLVIEVNINNMNIHVVQVY